MAVGKPRGSLSSAALVDYEFVASFFRDFRPDAVVHLGECPSAPYSMIDVDHATWVQQNNIVSTLNILFAMRDNIPRAHEVGRSTRQAMQLESSRQGWRHEP